MRIKSIILTAVILTASAVGVFAQGNDKITPAEYIEANEFSHTFADRLLKTKDIGPLLKDFFVQDFIEKMMDEEDCFINKDQTILLRPAQRHKICVSGNNLIYLSGLFIFSRNVSSIDANNDDDPYKDFPPSIRKFMVRILRKDFDGDFKPDPTSQSLKARQREAVLFANKMSRLVDGINTGMRRDAVKIKAGENKYWVANLAKVDKSWHFNVPTAVKCDARCYGYPAGSRLIKVNVPFFQLTLVKVDGRLRIANLLNLLQD